MKRMKKKVVAMVTLAMFIMTLLPMAAFAAPTETSLTADETTAEVTDNVKVTVATKDAAKVTGVELWAEDAEGNVVKNATFTGDNGVAWPQKDGVVSGSFTDKQWFNVSFAAAGDYVVKAGAWVETKLPGVEKPEKEFVEFVPTETITVTGTIVTGLSGAISATADYVANDDGVVSVPLKFKNGYQLNKVDVAATADVVGKLDKSTVTINNKYEAAGIKVVDKNGAAIDSVVLNNQGKAEFYVIVEKYTPGGSYNIDLSCNGFDGVAKVGVMGDPVNNDAVTIEALPVDGLLNVDDADASKAVKLAVKNANGELIVPTNEPIMGDKDGFSKVDYINVVKSPKNSLKDNMVSLEKAEDGNMSVVIAKSNLKVGDYAIEFVLKNGAKATVEFSVGKFNEKDIKDLVIESEKDVITVNYDRITGLVENSDIAPVEYKVYQVDGQGIKKHIDKAFTPGFIPAVNAVTVNFSNPTGTPDKFTAQFEGKAQDILGTKVTITAFDGERLAKKDYTFAENTVTGMADYKLVFDGADKEGKVLKNNAVGIKLVDAADKTVGLDSFYVNTTPVKVSNKDAKVIVTQTGSKTNPGLTIYSDKPTTVDVQVMVWASAKNGNNTYDKAVYADTLTYTIGAKDVHADTNVVLTIASKDMIVNNKVVKIDAAPFVDKNYRTMVPLSAITEAFGVTPEWNEKDRTVTVEMNGVKVVMTIDKKTYTVNGKEKTMDTAPVIVNSRTMVPVRFVAEELGFVVTPLYNAANGTTESVVISK